MPKTPTYTDADRETFLHTAEEWGIMPAVRRLGYPSRATAFKWVDEAGLDITKDMLAQKAIEMKRFYTVREKQIVLQEAIDRIYEMLLTDTALTAQELERLGNALARTIKTMQLLEGEPTAIKVEQSETDMRIKELVQQMEQRNQAINANADVPEPAI